MSYRDHFPILAHTAYLNSCSQGALSHQVAGAYRRYLEDWAEHGSPWELWVEHAEAARALFAGLVGAHPDEVAVTTSASAAVSAVASSLDFGGERDKVVLTDLEFPTIGNIWHAQESRGARVEHVAAVGGTVPPERIEEAVDDRTAVVSVTQVSYSNGARLDVAAAAEIAHRHGALLLVDSYQALGSMPVDATGLGADLLVGGTVKYLLGSAGLAFLYVRRPLAERLAPTMTGWFAQRDVAAMDVHGHDPAPTARRFDLGTPPVPSIYAGAAGLRLIRSWGTDEIAARIGELTTLIKDGAAARGFAVATPAERHGAMIALRATDAPALVGALAAEGVVVSSRAGNVRVSPHAYNAAGDVERLFAALDRHRDLLGRQT